MHPVNKQPLFVITGASCVGKSTICEVFFREGKRYILMESDLLWQDIYNTPQDDYAAYRRLWMRVCANISQIGMPVVLCGCAVLKQFESQPERALFTEIHYLALVCNEAVLEYRMCTGRKVSDESWIRASMDFNWWLGENAGETQPNITLLDTTHLTPEQAAVIAQRWILDAMENQ